MQTVAKKSQKENLAATPAMGKVPDIAAASVPDTLATLKVNPIQVLRVLK